MKEHSDCSGSPGEPDPDSFLRLDRSNKLFSRMPAPLALTVCAGRVFVALPDDGRCKEPYLEG